MTVTTGAGRNAHYVPNTSSHPGVFDVMEIVSWYRGKWDATNGRWETCKLTEAAAELGVEFHGEAHDALNDAITTMMLVRKMAGV